MSVRNLLEFDARIIEEHYAPGSEARAQFGGLLIDHEAGGVLAVYLREGAPRPWEAAVRLADRLAVRPALASLDELTALFERVQDASLNQASAAHVTDTRLDLDRGEVVVGFEPEALTGLSSELGPLPARSSLLARATARVVRRTV